MFCCLSSLPPSWKFNGHDLPSNVVPHVDGQLEILKVTVENHGEYVCFGMTEDGIPYAALGTLLFVG